jgi:hypothetical protein
LNDDNIAKLNASVDVDKKTVEEVAEVSSRRTVSSDDLRQRGVRNGRRRITEDACDLRRCAGVRQRR